MAEQPNEASRKSKAEGDRRSDEEAQAGISNRTRDEAARAAQDTPRRYDQPIEADDDPVMPTDDATVNTKI
jgi:hypothetical protein